MLGRGLEFGRITLVPDVDAGVSIEERRAAVAIADQLGGAAGGRGRHRGVSEPRNRRQQTSHVLIC